MRQIEIEIIGPQVCQLAMDAGEAILKVYESQDLGAGHPALLAYKSDESPLTLADLASHHVICDGLCRLTPNFSVVSEEDVASLAHRSPKGKFWLIDPLDGTKEFLARNGEFTVNIALIVEGEPVWGVVYVPVLGQMYWGGRAHGAFRRVGQEKKQIHVAAPVAVGGVYRVVASKSHLNKETSDFIARLGTVDCVQAGSSLKFCRIAEGNADIYPRFAPTCEWDTAAAQAVVEGAGGSVRAVDGSSLRYGKPEVLNPHFIAASTR
jgi:3'(2'), 5'-bisphosphate nucleotidase